MRQRGHRPPLTSAKTPNTLLFMTNGTTVDLVLTNGKIFTADNKNSVVEALYSRDGRIAALGRDEEVLAHAPRDCEVIDLGGRTAVPGFIDSHNHMLITATTLDMIDASFAMVSSTQGLVAAVAEAVKAAPPGAWVRGWGLDYDRFVGGEPPTRWDLDVAAPDNPVFILHVTGHHGLVNTRALEAAGIGQNVNDPLGGQFVRDARGRLTGLLLDSAQQVVNKCSVDVGRHAPSAGLYDASQEEFVSQIDRLGTMYLREGITSVVDAQVTARELRTYIAARRAGKLHVRMTCMPLSNHLDDLERLGIAGELGDDWLSIGPLKIYADGEPLACTAMFTQGYEGQPENRGKAYWTTDELVDLVGRAHRLGLQVGIHTVGDGAYDMSLRAIELALKESPRPDHRHRLEHALYARPEQLEKTAALGIIPVSQTRYFFDLGQTFIDNLGSRAQRLVPLRSELDLGIPIALGTDSPVASFRPLDTIASAVQRETCEGASLGTEERIPVLEAVRAYTINAAHSFFQEDSRGSLEKGKLADLVVLDGPLLQTAPGDIASLNVDCTILNGEVVHGG